MAKKKNNTKSAPIDAFQKIDALVTQTFYDARCDETFGRKKVYSVDIWYLDWMLEEGYGIPATPEAQKVLDQYIKEGEEERARVEKELQEIGKRQGWIS